MILRRFSTGRMHSLRCAFRQEQGERELVHFFYEADRKHTSTPKHNRKLRAHFDYIVKQQLREAVYGVKYPRHAHCDD